jgi:hypothetical protein
MKLSLYEIGTGLRKLFNEISESDGEITPEQESSLSIAQADLETKGINYALVIKECDSTVYAIDAEIERLTKLKTKPQTLAKKLKEKISEAMKEFGVEKIESDLIKLSFRKSKETVIENELELPESCFEFKRTISKTKVKELIESGELTTGAFIRENKSLQIK